MRQFAVGLAGVILSLGVALSSEARVVKFEVQSTTPFVGGATFGNAGAYQMLRGTAYLQVDPNDPRDAVIVDLENAPRNAQGLVEFSTPFMILQPTDPSRRTPKIFFAVNNRGNNLEGLLTATTAAQVTDTDAGFAMSKGYTIVDAGWEGDVVPTATNLVASLPVAERRNGDPITGLMRYEYDDVAAGTFTTNLEGTAGFQSYETADIDTSHAIFTVRSTVTGPKTPIAANHWAFGKCPTGQASLVPDLVDLCYFDGFDNTKIYEVIYRAKNPIVMALGFATTRDIASFLRFESQDDAGNPNPVGGHIHRAYAAGGSQTGGYLRDYIYLGFNEDESGRKVFDGIIPWIAGTDRVFINVRFADPNTYSEQDRQHNFLQSSYPPFTYAVTSDPLSGVHDGIMKRPQSDPLVMQVDSESEFWQLHDSLNVFDGLGNPVPVPANVRLYFVGNNAHGFISGSFFFPTPGSATLCTYGTPGSGLTWNTLRAALRNLDRWADDAQGNAMPPDSNYPGLSKDTLVPLAEAAAAFPHIPGVQYPTVVDTYELLEFGPKFDSLGGILTLQPPRNGPSYDIFVPKTDANGIQLAGVHQIEARVPIGTSTGWNVRTPAHRGPALCGLTGSYFPFATTRAQRVAAGDPRPSLEELYGTHDGFVQAVRTAVAQLVREQFLLEVDAEAAITAAQASAVLQ
jgi:hypothetical protein